MTDRLWTVLKMFFKGDITRNSSSRVCSSLLEATFLVETIWKLKDRIIRMTDEFLIVINLRLGFLLVKKSHPLDFSIGKGLFLPPTIHCKNLAWDREVKKDQSRKLVRKAKVASS